MATEEFYPLVVDEGQMGVKLVVTTKPSGCPGLGGWKIEPTGGWFTRVKGEEGQKILAVIKSGDFAAITIDGDRITRVER